MKQPQVRLLYGPKVPPEDARAAFRGIRGLGRFGVFVDNQPASRKSLSGVKLGNYIYQIITSERPPPVDFKAVWDRVSDMLWERHILGFGLTDKRLFLGENGYCEETVGAARFGDAVILSLSNFNDVRNHALRIKAIEVAARHEAGHLFWRLEGEEHCTNPSCVMQEKPISISARPGPIYRQSEIQMVHLLSVSDFCRDCQDRIQKEVNLRAHEINHTPDAGV